MQSSDNDSSNNISNWPPMPVVTAKPREEHSVLTSSSDILRFESERTNLSGPGLEGGKTVEERNTSSLVIYIVVPVVAGLVLIAICLCVYCFCCRKGGRRGRRNSSELSTRDIQKLRRRSYEQNQIEEQIRKTREEELRLDASTANNAAEQEQKQQQQSTTNRPKIRRSFLFAGFRGTLPGDDGSSATTATCQSAETKNDDPTGSSASTTGAGATPPQADGLHCDPSNALVTGMRHLDPQQQSSQPQQNSQHVNGNEESAAHFRNRITRYFQHYNPSKLHEVDTIIDAVVYANRRLDAKNDHKNIETGRSKLLMALGERYGPEPSPHQQLPSSGPSSQYHDNSVNSNNSAIARPRAVTFTLPGDDDDQQSQSSASISQIDSIINQINNNSSSGPFVTAASASNITYGGGGGGADYGGLNNKAAPSPPKIPLRDLLTIDLDLEEEREDQGEEAEEEEKGQSEHEQQQQFPLDLMMNANTNRDADDNVNETDNEEKNRSSSYDTAIIEHMDRILEGIPPYHQETRSISIGVTGAVTHHDRAAAASDASAMTAAGYEDGEGGAGSGRSYSHDTNDSNFALIPGTSSSSSASLVASSSSRSPSASASASVSTSVAALLSMSVGEHDNQHRPHLHHHHHHHRQTDYGDANFHHQQQQRRQLAHSQQLATQSHLPPPSHQAAADRVVFDQQKQQQQQHQQAPQHDSLDQHKKSAQPNQGDLTQMMLSADFFSRTSSKVPLPLIKQTGTSVNLMNGGSVVTNTSDVIMINEEAMTRMRQTPNRAEKEKGGDEPSRGDKREYEDEEGDNLFNMLSHQFRGGTVISEVDDLHPRGDGGELMQQPSAP